MFVHVYLPSPSLPSLSPSKGARALGPLLPAIAAAASHIHPLSLPSSLSPGSPTHKLFRNLWYYLALFHLTPPIPLSNATALPPSHSSGFTRRSPSPAPSAPPAYEWDPAWAAAVRQLAMHTPPLVSLRMSSIISGMKVSVCLTRALRRKDRLCGCGSACVRHTVRLVSWHVPSEVGHLLCPPPPLLSPPLQAVPSLSRVDDELELSSLHQPGSQLGSGSEAAGERQRRELAAALGGRLDGGTLAGITGEGEGRWWGAGEEGCMRAGGRAGRLP